MTRKAPATRLKESLPPDLLTARDVAERFEVNIETIRRLARKKDANGNKAYKAPSKAARTGDMGSLQGARRRGTRRATGLV